MSRPLRIEYPGAYYHGMNRGAARQKIFRDDGALKGSGCRIVILLSDSIVWPDGSIGPWSPLLTVEDLALNLLKTWHLTLLTTPLQDSLMMRN